MTERDQQENTLSPTVEVLIKELNRIDNRLKLKQTLFHTVYILVIVAAAAVLIATLMFPVLRIYGSSMSPVLKEGEIVFSVKTTEIKRSDIVAFYYGNNVLVKRCIGVPGDEISIDDEGNVFVNEEMINEPYVEKKAIGECDIEFPFQVPDRRFFVLGDQRETSIDSRNTLVGCIAAEQIIGRVIFRIWPLNVFGTIG